MDELEMQAAALGRQAAQAIGRINRNSADGLTRTTWTVSAVNSDGTCDLSRGSGDRAQTLTGIPYTTACVGIAAGARALVDTYRHQSVVTGVLASTADAPVIKTPVVVTRNFQLTVSASGTSSADIPCTVPSGYTWLCYSSPQTVGFVSYIYIDNDASYSGYARVWYGGGSGMVRVKGIYIRSELV